MLASKENARVAIDMVNELEKPVLEEREEEILAFLQDFLLAVQKHLPTEETIRDRRQHRKRR
jgi:hypothetical protein